MAPTDIFTLVKIVFLVGGINLFFRTKWGDAVGAFFPAPFWVYLLSIFASTFGLLPSSSPIYSLFSSLVLSAAIVLMLIGTPVKDIFRMGPQASMAMVIAAASIFLSSVVVYVLFFHWLPAESDSAIGALLGTWIGGSANMVSVKEILNLSDETLGALVLVDTVLSYSWMAFLFLGIRFQKKFDRKELERAPVLSAPTERGTNSNSQISKFFRFGILLVAGLLIGRILVFFGQKLNEVMAVLTATAWTLLVSTAVATLAASTPLQRAREWKSSHVGTFLLYTVLVTIGAKSSLTFTGSLHQYFLVGFLILMFHGAALFAIGWFLKLPLSLLATASQANIGGMISAPVLAEAYRKGSAHFGVLMAILGTVLGTYVGVVGGTVCHWLKTFFSRGG